MLHTSLVSEYSNYYVQVTVLKKSKKFSFHRGIRNFLFHRGIYKSIFFLPSRNSGAFTSCTAEITRHDHSGEKQQTDSALKEHRVTDTRYNPSSLLSGA